MGTGMRRNSSIFQSTLPQGERRSDWSYAEVCWRFQSTLPQGERPSYTLDATGIFNISIHAPARGATMLGRGKWKKEKFQSTLPQGERRFICIRGKKD